MDTREPGAPVFDHAEAVQRCFGQDRMFRKMVEDLFEEAEPLLDRLRAAQGQGDAAELAATAHRLKNTVVYLAARPAARVAQRLVDLGHAGDLTAAAVVIDELDRELERLKSALAEHRGGRAS